MKIKYKKYTIEFNPKPLPPRIGGDHDGGHADYDGEDDPDTEYSFCIGSVKAAKEYIDQMEPIQ